MKIKVNFKIKVGVFVGLTLLFAACSPKVSTTKTNNNNNNQPAEKQKTTPKKDDKKFLQAGISLLVPFKLGQINLKTAGKPELDRYAMPIDFYQGFKLGLDSAAASGLNFKLNVFDTEDDNANIATLYKNDRFKQSNLIVGPVFPAGLKFIANYAKAENATIVSPLAATNPAEFKNPNLISIVNNIGLHAEKIGAYLSKYYSISNTIVVLINPRKTEDEQFASLLRDYLRTKTKFIVQEYPSVFALETKMIKEKQYAIIVTSADKNFVSPTIEKLEKLKNLPTGGYDIDLFGHPNWVKQNYPADKLQDLNTIISSSYFIDYKKQAVIAFVKKYRSLYGFEPSEFSFKGFDVAYYFGKLLSKYGENFREYLTKEDYKGLHNNFTFIFDDKSGFINTNLMLLKYKNYALINID